MRKLFTVTIGLILFTITHAQTSPINISNNWYFDAPDAPDVQLSMQGGNIKIDISNSPISNNYNEAFNLLDTSIQNTNNRFLFQGYIIYQALNSLINPRTNFFDTSKMRVVAQSDILDNVDTLINHYLDTNTTNCNSAIMVQGNNIGIQHSYIISLDAFTNTAFQTGNTYCYYVFSYAYNSNKIGQDCNLPWSFLASFRGSNGQGMTAKCITLNPTGIKEYLNTLNIHFYPNPAKEKINVAFENIEKYVNIQIITIRGQKLLQKEYSNTNFIQLNLGKLSSGIYFAKITTDKGQKTIKFSKQ